MSIPNQDDEKREGLLPDDCKDLADALKHKKADHTPASPYPRITRFVSLPDKVSVQYLIDTTGASTYTMTLLMQELGIVGEMSRAIDFEDAAKILKHYGVGAKRAA